jgi:DNA-binding IclR family transcriptional regulator
VHDEEQMSEIKSVKRAMDILDVFGKDGGNLGVTEVARRLAMNKSTVTRVMSTLEEGGYLFQMADTRKYRLGTKILTLASIMLSKRDLRTIAAPHLKKLSLKTNEALALWIVDDGLSRICIERIEGNQDVKTAYAVGTRFPLYVGAPGKMLLAFLPEADQEEVIKRSQSDTNDRLKFKKVDEKVLRKELQKIREYGIAVSFDEIIQLFSSISVPIRDQSAKVIAAIGISGLTTHFTPDAIKEFGGLAKEAGLKISQELGCRELI